MERGSIIYDDPQQLPKLNAHEAYDVYYQIFSTWKTEDLGKRMDRLADLYWEVDSLRDRSQVLDDPETLAKKLDVVAQFKAIIQLLLDRAEEKLQKKLIYCDQGEGYYLSLQSEDDLFQTEEGKILYGWSTLPDGTHHYFQYAFEYGISLSDPDEAKCPSWLYTEEDDP